MLTSCATQQDFIDLYGEEETLEITNQCDPLSSTIDTIKLQAGLDNAEGIVNSRFLIAPDCGRALIKTSCKQITLWIARYILDTTKARPFVEEDYTRAMELLDYACTKCAERCPLSREEIEAILGENTSTRTRVRCYSGNGNKFKRAIPRIKVADNYYLKYYYNNFAIDYPIDRDYHSGQHLI